MRLPTMTTVRMEYLQQRLELLLLVLQLRLGGGGVQVFGPQCLERGPQLAPLLRAASASALRQAL